MDNMALLYLWLALAWVGGICLGWSGRGLRDAKKKPKFDRTQVLGQVTSTSMGPDGFNVVGVLNNSDEALKVKKWINKSSIWDITEQQGERWYENQLTLCGRSRSFHDFATKTDRTVFCVKTHIPDADPLHLGWIKDETGTYHDRQVTWREGHQFKFVASPRKKVPDE